MTDLFTNALTKKEQVYNFIKQKGYAKTHEVIEFGSSIYYNRALRSAQELAAEYPPKIKRLSHEDKVFRFGMIKEDAWVIA